MIRHTASSDSLCLMFFCSYVEVKVATLLWLLCASHCFAVFVLQDDDTDCFHDWNSLVIQGHISVALCVAVAVLVPIMAFLLERRGPDTLQQDLLADNEIFTGEQHKIHFLHNTSTDMIG